MVLEVDHIVPVIENGGNDAMNLITACFNCNRGKGKRTLSNTEQLKKQKNELDNLQEKREQLELMYLWKKDLLTFEESTLNDITNYFESSMGNEIILSYTGKNILKKNLKDFGLELVLESIDIAILNYSQRSRNIETGADIALKKVGGIAYNIRKERGL